MSPADVDTVIATVLAADFPCQPCDVEVPWLWGDVQDPTSYTLHGHVDEYGKVSNMRLVPDDGGWVEPVPAAFEAMARCDLRETAENLWRKR